MTAEFVCQFMRVESFARVPSAKVRKSGHRSAKQIVDELVREPHASPHVSNPRPPSVIFGDPYVLLAKAERMANEARDPRGRKLRRDAHILAGCVVSYPVTVESVSSDDHEGAMLLKWIDDVIGWAKKEFGERELECAVLHMDETSPHLHLMLLPPAPGIDPSPLRRVGRAARLAATEKSKTSEKKIYLNDIWKLEQNAIKEEGRLLQDSLHADVSAHYGHLRHSLEPEPRLSPKAYRRRKAAEDSLRKTQQAMKARERELREEREAARKQNQMLGEWQVRLTKKEAQMEEHDKELATREAEIAAHASAIHKMMLSPAMALVDALLHRGLSEVNAKLGGDRAKILSSIIQHARKVIGLPEITENSPAGDVSDVQLRAMVQQLHDAERDVRTTIGPPVTIGEPQAMSANVDVVEQDDWDDVAPQFNPAA